MGGDALHLARRELLPAVAGGGPAHRRVALGRVRSGMEAHLGREYGIRCHDRGPADCVVHRPGLVSTAFDFDSGHFVGLHIDNHQRLPLGHRDRSHVLFAVNVGLSHRYVVFVPQTVKGLLGRLGKLTESGLDETDSVALKEEFLVTYADEPVLRIRLEPGDAYLCSPQNLIHDGATNESGSADVAVLMSGDYRWRVPR
ncbi:hypothetical protein ACFWYA_22100 [Streptomyces sp. NPDC059011]|uniref:hypothetical protein n=1 Tax=unclassified Streptomyces TaxID=2593676 RepID=UPI0036918EFC